MKNYYKVKKANGEVEYYEAYSSDMYDFIEQPSYEGCDVSRLKECDADGIDFTIL